jgi:hypothetical protein
MASAAARPGRAGFGKVRLPDGRAAEGGGTPPRRLAFPALERGPGTRGCLPAPHRDEAGAAARGGPEAGAWHGRDGRFLSRLRLQQQSRSGEDVLLLLLPHSVPLAGDEGPGSLEGIQPSKPPVPSSPAARCAAAAAVRFRFPLLRLLASESGTQSSRQSLQRFATATAATVCPPGAEEQQLCSMLRAHKAARCKGPHGSFQ